jgi:hypothetical protein
MDDFNSIFNEENLKELERLEKEMAEGKKISIIPGKSFLEYLVEGGVPEGIAKQYDDRYSMCLEEIDPNEEFTPEKMTFSEGLMKDLSTVCLIDAYHRGFTPQIANAYDWRFGISGATKLFSHGISSEKANAYDPKFTADMICESSASPRKPSGN